MGAGLKFCSPKGLPRAVSRTEKRHTGKGADIGGSHGRYAEPRNWFLCRHSDERAQKSPAEAGLKLVDEGSLPPQRPSLSINWTTPAQASAASH